MCCSITQLSANFISTSANAIGRSLRGMAVAIADRALVSSVPILWAIVAAVHCFAVLVGPLLSPGAYPVA